MAIRTGDVIWGVVENMDGENSNCYSWAYQIFYAVKAVAFIFYFVYMSVHIVGITYAYVKAPITAVIPDLLLI